MRTGLDRQRKTLAKMIENMGRVVAFTGAGISAESGIPTFRGSGGLWEKYPPVLFGNLPGLALSLLFLPGRFRRFVGDALRTFFLFVVPVLVVINVPARVMAQPLRPETSLDWSFGLFALAATIFSLLISRWIFTQALTSYRSASS